MKAKLQVYLLLFISLIAYYILAYETLRTEVYQVFALFGVLFLAYGLLYKSVRDASTYKWLLFASILFRVILLFALPNLSDDFYRFNWDGRLLVNGISPFEALPIHFMDGTYLGIVPDNLTNTLYSQLNSPEYFTIYPPVCQFIFWFSCFFFPNDLYGATVLMKTFLLFFEIGSIYLLYRMVQAFGIAPKKILLYALNPLVIVELTGNLHFEAAMIFFTLLAVRFVLPIFSPSKGEISLPDSKGDVMFFEGNNRNIIFSAIAMGLAVSSKLIPLIFLPFFISYLGFRKSILYGGIVGIVTFLGFLPLFTFDILQNLLSSVGLYFQKFEFNASIYYLVRWLGYQQYGYNVIQTAGRNLAILTLVSILLLAFWRSRGARSQGRGVKKIHLVETLSLLQNFLFALLIYFAFANIVHPWYVNSLVALCIFTSFRFPILWSGMVVLTYYTYLTDSYTENLYLVALEYIVVYAYLGWELAFFGGKKREVGSKLKQYFVSE
ncbi:MAG: hypothetical protein ACPGVB_01590 [Chitinophagales bacterium]